MLAMVVVLIMTHHKVKEITGLDLDHMIDIKSLPKNIKLEVGSA